MTHWKILLVLPLLIVFGSAVPRAAARQGCGSADVADEDARAARLRACFKTTVAPALARGETSEAALEAAFDAYFSWNREAQLGGFSDTAFPDEHARATASLERGLKRAYAVRQDECRRMPHPAAAARLLVLFRTSQLIGWIDVPMFPSFGDDFAACMKGGTYRITIRSTTASELMGPSEDLTYVAVLHPDPADPDELIGIGVYSGYVVSSPNATPKGPGQPCVLHGTRIQFPLRGKVEASGSFIDLSPLGGPNGMTYILATTDWPLMPLFADPKDAYARTEEDKEGVKGTGTVARIEPLPLKGPVTDMKDVQTSDGGECAGTVTETETVRIERLGR